MSTSKHNMKLRYLPCLAIGALVIIAVGCQDSTPQTTTGPTTQAVASATPQKGGAQLWSEYCVRCHNLRPPTEFSNAQWQVIVHHMRVRGNLTGEEQTKILAFLKSANM